MNMQTIQMPTSSHQKAALNFWSLVFYVLNLVRLKRSLNLSFNFEYNRLSVRPLNLRGSLLLSELGDPLKIKKIFEGSSGRALRHSNVLLSLPNKRRPNNKHHF